MGRRRNVAEPGASGGGNPRREAVRILCRVESGAYADRLLDAGRRSGRLSPADRNLLQELVQGTLTWQAAIDHVLGPYLAKPLWRQTPEVRCLLRVSVYQLRYLDRVPGYAVVSEAVEIARSSGGSGGSRFVNAVLRGVSEDRRPARWPDRDADPVAHLALAASHPEWMIRRWSDRYGWEDCRRLCDHNNGRPPLSIRVNARRTTTDELVQQLARDGIEATRSPLLDGYLDVAAAGPLFATQAHREGLFAVHGPGAGLVVRLLAPLPGDTVLDVCSAPGGKSAAAAQDVGPQGRVIALDLRPGRLRTLRRSVARLGLRNVLPAAGDACRMPLSDRFPRVLVDAPCSSLGILSRHPELKWRRKAADIRQLADRQRQMLCAAADVVRPGGSLVYGTCTTEPEENEGVVEAFLAARPDFSLVPAGQRLRVGVRGPYLQVLPHEHGVDAAFGALLRRA